MARVAAQAAMDATDVVRVVAHLVRPQVAVAIVRTLEVAVRPARDVSVKRRRALWTSRVGDLVFNSPGVHPG